MKKIKRKSIISVNSEICEGEINLTDSASIKFIKSMVRTHKDLNIPLTIKINCTIEKHLTNK